MGVRISGSLQLRMTLCLVGIITAVAICAAFGFQQLYADDTPPNKNVIATFLALCATAGIAGPLLVWYKWINPLCKQLNLATEAAQKLADGKYDLFLEDSGHDQIGQLLRHIHRAARSSVEDLEKRQRDQRSLSHQATHDDLTGLSNRKFGNEIIARLENSDRDAPTSILFLDLDGFKAVNDTQGHAIGDEILIAVSLRMKAILSDDTILIRWGGDEFVIVLPGAPPRAAISVAQDVADLFKQPFSTTDGVHKLGCSIGLSTSRPDTSLGTILQEADASMYNNKRKRKRAKPAALSSQQDVQQANGGVGKAA